jgi:GcrA cell cycle regulator
MLNPVDGLHGAYCARISFAYDMLWSKGLPRTHRHHIWGLPIAAFAAPGDLGQASEGFPVMGWTDERVETLKKLWLDGLSASQIAGQLGGVTRNAVIGKVHRLGLSGRAAPSQPTRPAFKPVRPPRPASGATPSGRRLAVAEIAEAAPHPEPEPVPVAAAEPEPEAPAPEIAPAAPVEILPAQPERGAATVLTLGAHMCKWPIGDPSTADFTFCGRRASPEGPYCVEHARLAYQPHPAKKKAASPADLARSLRRYV